MTLPINGLILKVSNSKESDRTIALLTEQGLLYAYAKAARNVKSKKFAATNPLCYSHFVLFEGKDLYIVNEAECKEVFFELRNDIEKMSLAQYFCELLLYITPESSDTSDVLRLTLNSLHFLCKSDKDINLIKSVFELKLMCFMGFMPDLLACAECAKFEGDMYFDIVEGMLYCVDCKPSNSYTFKKITPSMLSVMRHIVFSDFSKLFSFQASKETLLAVADIIESYTLNKTERQFKTLKFFHSVRI